MEPQDKKYIKSNKKWKDFKLDPSIIDALKDMNKNKPTRVQQQSLNFALNPDRKKFNLLLRAINGSGKTLAFLLPMINALESGLKTAQDKTVRGKVAQNQIFRPQGVIIIQNILLQSQLNNYLHDFNDYGEAKQIDKLKFKIGKLNNDGHTHGDIIICMTKSFLNRHVRNNMKLDQCKFIAIDQIDDIYHHDKQSLSKLLSIIKDSPANLISTSATMEKKFKDFYGQIDPNYIAKDLNAEMSKETGGLVTLEGVKNFCHSIDFEDRTQVHEYVLKTVFKQLYRNTEKVKQQVFIFFNSTNQIQQFKKLFDTIASDFTTQESEYLKDISKAVLAAKIFKDGQKVDMPINQKQEILTKFRNNEINVLLCTNIMARGIDIRNVVFVINVGAPKRNQKEDDVDVDIYLHRVGRTGRHNDKGVALTISDNKTIKFLAQRVKIVHKIDIKPMESVEQVVKQVLIAHQGNVEEPIAKS